MATVESGHRTVPATGGVVLDAWGHNRGQCFSQAVHALVAAFADVTWAETSEPAPIHLEPDSDESLLVALLEEVLWLVRVLGVVPVDGAVVDTEDGGLAGCFDVAAITHVRILGRVPRAVTRPRVEGDDTRAVWRCQVSLTT